MRSADAHSSCARAPEHGFISQRNLDRNISCLRGTTKKGVSLIIKYVVKSSLQEMCLDGLYVPIHRRLEFFEEVNRMPKNALSRNGEQRESVHLVGDGQILPMLCLNQSPYKTCVSFW